MQSVLHRLTICLLFIITSCAGTKPITYEQAKEVAEKKTENLQVPVEVQTLGDSTGFNVHPDEMEPEKPIEQITSTGLSLTATKQKDGSLDIKARQAPIHIRDTVEVPVVMSVFNECEIDGHLTPEQAEKKIEEEVARHLQRKQESVKGNLKEGLIDVVLFIAWSIAGLLFFFLLTVAYRIYQAFSHE